MAKTNFTKHPPVKPATQQESDDAGALLGSAILEPVLKLSESKEILLGDLVAETHKSSGLSAEEWNDLSQEDRDEALIVKLESLTSETAEAEAEADAEKAKTAAKKSATGAYIAVFGGPIHHPTSGKIFTNEAIFADEDQWLTTQITAGKIKEA